MREKKEDWRSVALRALKLGFNENEEPSESIEKINQSMLLFSSIIDSGEVDEPWPYIKYAGLLSCFIRHQENKEEHEWKKVELYKKAYLIEKNTFSCLGLLDTFLRLNLLLDALSWLKELGELDPNNQYIEFYFKKIIP